MPAKTSAKVDVAVNIHGKPYQSAVTLLSLLEHSGEHIGKVHLTIEKRQPFGADPSSLLALLGDRAEVHHPRFWFGTRPQRIRVLMHWGPYRRSFRYQHAWERSKAPFLFITHNDVLYTGDIIGALLGRIEGRVAAGPVGQCWNCPASIADVCAPEKFMSYRPSHSEWLGLAGSHPGPREAHYPRVVDMKDPWPLPECRLNEWSALIDLSKARPATMPFGKAVPFGALYGLDIGTQWFHDVVLQGLSVQHVDITPYAQHAWASATGGGHAALSDRATYDAEEAKAKQLLADRYGIGSM